MSTEADQMLIGPSSDPPPFIRSQAAEPRGALPTARWRDLIRQICTTWKVDPIRVEGHMVLESGGQDVPINSSGAVGLMQIVPKVWPELCQAVCRAHDVPNEMASWRLPEINIEIGVRELKWWIEEKCGGDGDGGTCAYFSGHCIPDGSADSFDTTDHQYVAIVRRNMDRVRADMGGSPGGQASATAATFSTGNKIRVADGPLNLRTDVGTQAKLVESLATGTALVVIGGPTQQEGHDWYQVQVVDAPGHGWVAGTFCERITA